MISKECIEYWDTRYTNVKQGDSIPIPFKGFEHLFKGRDVLEIGPGEGRQFQHIYNKTAFYSIADITMEVFKHEIYKNKVMYYQISDYSNDLEHKFNLIHFWYVLHHVLDTDLKEFINFLYRHLTKGGMCLFNTPCINNGSKEFISNGMQTTPFTFQQIKEAVDEKFYIYTKIRIEKNSTGYLIIMQKIGD